MIIKKFVGKTEKDAIEAAQKELGNNIVIMNTKQTKKKGFFSFLHSHQIEVTVALEEEGERLSPVPKEKRLPALEGDREVIRNGPSPLSPESRNIEQKLDNLQNLLVSQLYKSEEEKKEEEEEAVPKATEKEVEEEKETEQVKFMKLLYNKMLDNEVDERYANQIMEEIDKLNKPNMPIDYTLTNTYQRMILKFGLTEGVLPAQEGPKVVFFIGPTGVGKTTTVAKIASHYVIEEKKKVALLTADTYRIAATEQLKTYANILEVPFRVVYSEEELKDVVKKFADYDYIFVDTTGHSHQNEEQIEKTRNLVHSLDEIVEKQVFLVLSATTKYKDLRQIADNYKQIAEFELIFTKLDETSSFGNILNLKMYTNAPVAYVTLGQNVPDDIEIFSPQKTVKQLLGGKNS